MGKIRITGMNSGLDTDAMVRELVNAYEKQGEKYTKTKKYAEEVAKEKLGLVKEDEIIFKEE